MHESVSPVEEIFARDTIRSGVLVADGHGLLLRVERGHLKVRDGIGEHRRERRFARATHRLRRVVVLGHAGSITFEAIRWMVDTGIAYVHLASDGRLLATTAALGLDHAALRRAQALAATGRAGLAITVQLLDRKLSGQSRVAHQLRARTAASAIEKFRQRLVESPDVESCRPIEAAAAAAYWNEAWAGQPINFVRRDRPRLPVHWTVFESRQTALRTVSGARRATTPANALLNYLYALGEAEARFALLAVGLDPGIGFAHADQKARDSAALDLLEAIRPDIDAYVLRLLRERRFGGRDFAEMRDGACRILAPLTHELADTMTTWARLLAPVAERVAAILAESYDRVGRLPTPLTQGNRSAGRRVQRKRPPRQSKAQPRLPRAVCQTCGATVSGSSRRVCDQCLSERRSLAGTIGRRGANQEPLGRDLAADRNKRRDSAIAWEETNEQSPVDRRVFREQIQPRLAGVPIAAMVEATGLSASYCARIRNGPTIPHPRHWEALRGIVDSDREARGEY